MAMELTMINVLQSKKLKLLIVFLNCKINIVYYCMWWLASP